MSLPRTFLTAGWEHVPLLNYTVPRSLLEPLVPRGTEQELWEVECIASLVGFQFLGTRVRGVPLDDRTDEGPFRGRSRARPGRQRNRRYRTRPLDTAR